MLVVGSRFAMFMTDGEQGNGDGQGYLLGACMAGNSFFGYLTMQAAL